MTPGCSIKLQQQQVARVIVATATKRAGVRARDTVCLSLTQSTVVWDGRTDGQTDRQTPQPDRAAPRRPSGQICCASCRQSARQLSTTNDRASERASERGMQRATGFNYSLSVSSTTPAACRSSMDSVLYARSTRPSTSDVHAPASSGLDHRHHHPPPLTP